MDQRKVMKGMVQGVSIAKSPRLESGAGKIARDKAPSSTRTYPFYCYLQKTVSLLIWTTDKESHILLNHLIRVFCGPSKETCHMAPHLLKSIQLSSYVGDSQGDMHKTRITLRWMKYLLKNQIVLRVGVKNATLPVNQAGSGTNHRSV
jgi:hypothetical protein